VGCMGSTTGLETSLGVPMGSVFGAAPGVQ
jgi:hypothetical protein